mmetsp:Transcript_66150/g.172090  ORF Transcript_66150/g.172090 Transcript_66150/m.172090 type:complete len:217 (+) Transcript_66150:199-849(+)
MSKKAAPSSSFVCQKALFCSRASRASCTSGMMRTIGAKKGCTTKLMKPICPLGTAFIPAWRSHRGDTSRPRRSSSSPWSQNSARTFSVQFSINLCGLHGLEMSAACKTDARMNSFLSSAFCLPIDSLAGAESSSSASQISSSTNSMRSDTCLECLAMSVARTLSMRPFRTYCCTLWDPAASRFSFRKNWNQLLSASACMTSNAEATCMFSKMLLSL